MLLVAVILGVLAGLVAGGRLSNLMSARLRFGALIIAGLLLRVVTQRLIDDGVDVVEQLRLPLFALSFGLVVVALWLNRSQPGLLLAMVGVSANGLAVVLNGGYMPVYLPAVELVGLSVDDLSTAFNTPLPTDLGWDFLLAGGPLGDVLPIGIPLLTNVISLGDVLLAAGIAWFLFSAVARGSSDPDSGVVSMWSAKARTESSGDPTPTRAGLDRPVVIGSGMGPGLSSTRPGATFGTPPAGSATAVPGVGQRIREHPYARLARDPRFSAFWLAGTISLFGDRLHQIALGVMVLAVTGSAMQTGLVFLAATLPNLVLGPIAGTFVDRWDQKRVMVATDLLRAALVVTLPFLAEVHIWLIYPAVFLITTISLFFRPAKAAIVPRIVPREDLTPANGAMWTGETVADIAGYPLAGVFVAMVGANLALAFWIDAATYIVSAVLLAGLVIPLWHGGRRPVSVERWRPSSRSCARDGTFYEATRPSSRTRW